MKIICVNNYDDANVSDKLVAENVSELDGAVIVHLLNCYDRASDEWFKLVPDDYKLYDAIKALYGE